MRKQPCLRLASPNQRRRRRLNPIFQMHKMQPHIQRIHLNRFADFTVCLWQHDNKPKPSVCQEFYSATPNIDNSGERFRVGKTESQKGQRLTLRCAVCKRVLRIYYKQKTVSSPAKLVVLDGSVHQTQNNTTRIHVRCKCGNKTVFENKSVSKHGWRRIESL
jgi:hypothetical protein